MPYLQLRFSTELAYPNHARNALIWPIIHMADYVHGQTIACQWNSKESTMKRIYPFLASVGSLRLHILRANANVRQRCCLCESHKSTVDLSPFKVQALNEDAEVDGSNVSKGSCSDESRKEEQRRRKIGLANRGRVPWNKGRRHTEETRLRIKQRTIEALRDPKVRKKMSEHPQLHSDETKAKIRSSLKRVWDKRLKSKRAKEKYVLSWSENVAEAAKKGGNDQQELEWGSYNKIKQEIALEQLQWAEEKAKAKELAKLRAEKAAAEKAEKMARLAQRKKEQEGKAKARREMRKKQFAKSEHEKSDTAVASELQLRRRLTKIRRKKSKHGGVAIGRDRRVISVMPNWEKLDVELKKKERMQREASLAEQIQAAKNRRAREELPKSSSADSQFSIVRAERVRKYRAFNLA